MTTPTKMALETSHSQKSEKSSIRTGIVTLLSCITGRECLSALTVLVKVLYFRFSFLFPFLMPASQRGLRKLIDVPLPLDIHFYKNF